MEAYSKLCTSYLVGGRGADCTEMFAKYIASRLDSCVQLTTDAHAANTGAFDSAFHGNVDYFN